MEVDQLKKKADDEFKKQAYMYMWKSYDLSIKSKAEFYKDHIYTTNPVKALGPVRGKFTLT